MTVKVTNHRTRVWRYVDQTYGGDPSGVDGHTKSAQQTVTWSNIRVGTENPGWRAQIRAGLEAGTGYTANLRNVTTSSGLAYARWRPSQNSKYTYETVISGWIYNSYIDSVPDASALSVPSALDKDARLKFLSKVRDARTRFQSGTFFGELAETVRMIRSPAKAVRHSLDGYHARVTKLVKKYRWGVDAARRTVNKSAAKRLNRALQEEYLEWSYGVRPLVGDTYDALSLLDADPYRVSEEFSASASDDVSMDRQNIDVGGSSPVNTRGYLITKGSVKVKYKGALAGSQGQVPSFSEQAGGNLSNFVPTVWNLIPYSFLVDYFTTVGKVIDGVSLGTCWFRWGCKVVVKKVNVTLVDTTFFGPFGSGVLLSSGSSPPSIDVTGTYLERIPVANVSVGFSDVHFRIPGIESPWKWLNIAALASLKTPRE